MEYPKIETLYDRDPQTFKVIPDRLRLPEFDLVKRWLVTEKIDGTNIRIILKKSAVPTDGIFYRGRTDDAQMPAFLLEMLKERFPYDKVAAAFEPDTDAIIFGEGYGPKIQKAGGNYRKDPGFRIFDVVVFGGGPGSDWPKAWWLNWASVEDVARKIGVETVPVLIWEAELFEAMAAFRDAPSHVALFENDNAKLEMEGVVARTDPLLFTRNGRRVILETEGAGLLMVLARMLNIVAKALSSHPSRCGRCGILTGPDHEEEILVGGVCGWCWEERRRGVPDIPDEEED